MAQPDFNIHLRFVFALLLAVTLEIYPLTEATSLWRPQWVLLTVLFWILRHPESYGLGTAFCAGLFLDLVVGVTPGRYALALTVSACVMIIVQQRMRYLSGLQQVLLVTLLGSMSAAIVCGVDRLVLGSPVPSRDIYWTGISTGVVWILIQLPTGRHLAKS